jgi:dGTPase
MERAVWAVRADTSRGRFHPEPEAPTRSPWQRDRDRIIHSSAFRKLQYKTQVFVNHEGDFYRTRLTHSIEVAQIARSVARELLLDEDLAEALALAHDLGHPPFGHAGEEALSAAMKPFGGFDHNAQSLRVVTLLESRYAAFDGLNLTWETLEGLAKHNGPLRKPPPYVADYDARHRLDLPITVTIWMTGCAPRCSISPILPICPLLARHWPPRAVPAWTCRHRGCVTRRSGG